MNPHVHIFSFGYHRSGIPADPSGNGGGFVFDCRLLPNPGQESQYAPLSGLDEEVRTFLENRREVWDFLAIIFPLVDHALARYGAIDYEALQVCFGCTGGQHRSVFCAEELAAHLRSRGVPVNVTHTEQGTWW